MMVGAEGLKVIIAVVISPADMVYVGSAVCAAGVLAPKAVSAEDTHTQPWPISG